MKPRMALLELGTDSDLRTNVFQGTSRALRFSRGANLATVVDQAMTEIDPFFLGQDLGKVLFNFLGINMPGEAESIADPPDVRVYHDA